MPVFQLIDAPVFPRPTLAEPGGLLAVGGDLCLERLVAAYRRGIFPWYDETSPILWWSPDPRPILLPWEVRVTKRLARTIRSEKFHVTIDVDFGGVIRGCAQVSRRGEHGTWILPEMIAAYEALHVAGYAHSAEAWQNGELVGGAYGVAMGKAFFGESMFHRVTDASKVAFVALAQQLDRLGFHFIDCQQTTIHLCSFGAFEVSRQDFLRRLELARDAPVTGTWRLPGQTEGEGKKEEKMPPAAGRD